MVLCARPGWITVLLLSAGFPCRDWARLTGRHYTYVHSAELGELLGGDLIGLWVGSRSEPCLTFDPNLTCDPNLHCKPNPYPQ